MQLESAPADRTSASPSVNQVLEHYSFSLDDLIFSWNRSEVRGSPQRFSRRRDGRQACLYLFFMSNLF